MKNSLFGSFGGRNFCFVVPVQAGNAGSSGTPWIFVLDESLEGRLLGDTYRHSPLWNATQQLLPFLESSAIISPSPASDHLHLSPPHLHDFLRSQEGKLSVETAFFNTLLSSGKGAPKLCCLEMVRKKTAYDPINYPETPASLYHLEKPTISKGQVVSCSPLRTILPAPACGCVRVMDCWKGDLHSSGDQ